MPLACLAQFESATVRIGTYHVKAEAPGFSTAIAQDFTVTVSSMPSYRPNLLGDPMAPLAQRNIDNYFNKDNVVIPVDPQHPNPFGNAGRNTVRA